MFIHIEFFYRIEYFYHNRKPRKKVKKIERIGKNNIINEAKKKKIFIDNKDINDVNKKEIKKYYR